MRDAVDSSDEPSWELFDGAPVMQQSERSPHAEVKMALYHALFDAIRQSALPFEIAIDSLGVKISDRDLYEPDVVVFPSGLIGPDDLFARKLIIVAEVLSPSTTKVDLTTKLAGYSRVETIKLTLCSIQTRGICLTIAGFGDAAAAGCAGDRRPRAGSARHRCAPGQLLQTLAGRGQ